MANKTEENPQKNKAAEAAEVFIDEQPEENEKAKKPHKAGAKKEDAEKAKLTAQLDKAEEEKEDYLNALKRERADFENYKKRNSAAIARAYGDGAEGMAIKLLPAIDNLERALAAEPDEENPLRKGVAMVLKQFGDLLKSEGIEEIEALGAPFDPEYHNAVMQADAEDGEESGIVKEVLMRGYKTKDKVLRHSMVKVTN